MSEVGLGSLSMEVGRHKQCDQRKTPKVHKSCPKMISLEKLKILAPTQKLPKTVGDLGKLIVT